MKFLRLTLLQLFLLATSYAFSQDVVINEMMSSNSTIITDDDGDYNDWIELYNNSSNPVSLNGYGLTDNPEQPFKWVFPDVIIQANSHLLVWCSDKNRIIPEMPLHTNWKISAEGENIMLSNPDGTVIDLFPAIAIPENFSYGNSEDANGAFVYFETPTPGIANATQTGYTEILNPPSFSTEPGFYNEAFTLSLSTDIPDATIIYTLDGSEPNENNLNGKTYHYKNTYPQQPSDPFGILQTKTITTYIYSAPINILDRSELPNSIAQIATGFYSIPYYIPATPLLKGTVVRAKVIKAGAMPSSATTANYFVSQTGPGKFALPVVAISVDNDDYFDYEQGINVPGKDFDDWRTENPTAIADGATPANYMRSGSTWEKKGNFSYFDQEMQVLNQDVGIRIHGGYSRETPNRSFRIYGRSEFGQGTFSYPVFPSSNHNSYKRLIFRNSGNDNYSTMFRDAFIQKLVGHFNMETQQYQPSVVFLNSEYWGIYNIRERFDTKYFERMYNIDGDDLDYLEAYGLADEGDANHYYSMLDYIANNPLSDEANYNHVNTLMDTDNFIDHFITNIFIANTDWPHNNIEFWRKRTASYEPNAPYGHDGKWRWVLKDTDFGFGLSATVNHNTLEYATAPTGYDDMEWPNFLLSNLLQNEIFKNKFITRFADVLNSAFIPSRVSSVLFDMKNAIAPEMQRHISRWKHIGSISNWNSNVNQMAQFAMVRPQVQRDHLRSKFGISANLNATLNVNDSTRGFIKMNTIEISSNTPGIAQNPYPWTGIYFHNIPVTLKAIPRPGYEFSHWSGAANGSEEEISLTPTASFSITAHFIESEETVADTPIYFWMIDNDVPNNMPLQVLEATYFVPDDGAIVFESALEGYPFNSSHPNWRKASMERRNSPTSINYIPEANDDVEFADSNMKALQITQPFKSNGRENTLIFNSPSTGFEQIKFAFAAKDEGAADAILIDYSVNAGIPVWTAANLTTSTLALSNEYQLFETDFEGISNVNDNPNFKIRLRFSGSDMTADNGKRVTFNNFSFTGVEQNLSVPDLKKAFGVFPNPFSDILYIQHDYVQINYKIFSVDGKFISEGLATSYIELGTLSQGLYLLQLTSNGQTEIKKIIKR